MSHHLKSKGHQVSLATRDPSGFWGQQNEAKLIEIDWENPQSISKACEGQDVVIQAAGLGASASHSDPDKAILVNAIYPERIAELAKKVGVKKFLYLSTVHAYSENLNGSYSEDSPTNNPHPYATSHVKGEKSIRDLASPEFQVIILRMGNVFGRPQGEFGNSRSLVIHDFVIQALSKGSIEIQSPVNTMRNFVPGSYVSELIRVIVELSPDTPIPKIINVAWKDSKNLEQVCNQIASLVTRNFGFPPTVLHQVPPKKNEEMTLQISSEIAQGLLKQDSVTFEAELERLIEFTGASVRHE
jgi:UDP-glucose 4-epimerase